MMPEVTAVIYNRIIPYANATLNNSIRADTNIIAKSNILSNNCCFMYPLDTRNAFIEN